MKVVRVDNFDRGRTPSRKKVVAGPGLDADEADCAANDLNARRNHYDYFRVVPDDYELRTPWEP